MRDAHRSGGCTWRATCEMPDPLTEQAALKPAMATLLEAGQRWRGMRMRDLGQEQPILRAELELTPRPPGSVQGVPSSHPTYAADLGAVLSVARHSTRGEDPPPFVIRTSFLTDNHLSPQPCNTLAPGRARLKSSER